MFSAMMMAAITPATTVSHTGATSAPSLALSRVNITSGTMAKGSWKAITTAAGLARRRFLQQYLGLRHRLERFRPAALSRT